jgi:hypothetical protein
MKIKYIILLVVIGLFLFARWIKKRPYNAMKILSKTKITDKKSVNNSISEIVETFIPSSSLTSSSPSASITDMLQKLVPSSLNDVVDDVVDDDVVDDNVIVEEEVKE